MNEKRIVIIGAGPAGLGAAHRLAELKYKNWDIYEKNPYVGGLCASLEDGRGFTWDIGLHVIFSNIPYFNNVISSIFKKDYYEHMRRSFIFKDGKWIPYPFQNNIKYLEPREMNECVRGLIRMHRMKRPSARNFEDWIHNSFGSGIAKYFMFPYNEKVWRHPLNRMSYSWIGERVSVINIEKVLDNIINNKEDISWGLHNKFRYPARGGSGEIFRRISRLSEKTVHLGKELVRVDQHKKELSFRDGTRAGYDYLINTSPLDIFIKDVLKAKENYVVKAAAELAHTKACILGIGYEGPKKQDTFWAYFPSPDISFYRMTYSAYSPHNVPKKNANTIMCEVSSRHFNKDPRKVCDRIIRDLLANEIMTPGEKRRIISKFVMKADRSYPIPTLRRDKALDILLPYLKSLDIYSRGRFGAWKYEVGNMDHSFMQGLEAVDNILLGKKENIICPRLRRKRRS